MVIAKGANKKKVGTGKVWGTNRQPSGSRKQEAGSKRVSMQTQRRKNQKSTNQCRGITHIQTKFTGHPSVRPLLGINPFFCSVEATCSSLSQHSTLSFATRTPTHIHAHPRTSTHINAHQRSLPTQRDPQHHAWQREFRLPKTAVRTPAQTNSVPPSFVSSSFSCFLPPISVQKLCQHKYGRNTTPIHIQRPRTGRTRSPVPVQP